MRSILRTLTLLLLCLAVSSTARAAEDEFALMSAERIGALRIQLPESDVKKALGEPGSRGKVVRSDADGKWVQQWSWPDKGVELCMESGRKAGPRKVGCIRITAPSTFKTSRNIGIGSKLADLKKAYAKEANAEDSGDDHFVAGSLYGGVIFDIKDGRVSTIFVGAAAE